MLRITCYLVCSIYCAYSLYTYMFSKLFYKYFESRGHIYYTLEIYYFWGRRIDWGISICLVLGWLNSSVAQLRLTLCYPMHCSTPGLPVHHQLPEFTQTHVHWVGDAIQPSHPLSSPSPPVFNLSQHQGLFQGISGQSIGVSALPSVLPMNSQDWFPLGWTSWISL